ncbi:triple functional domain protein-like [Corythoichthys intestinalis]|uniref:triple functional domain protein-like n=1 Tax=Corythoichthys intestinalis TaxID=161448 RepID=UPI0025A5206B|nr:triple functional domain protein-like [Corythoichthys intestinalis]
MQQWSQVHKTYLKIRAGQKTSTMEHLASQILATIERLGEHLLEHPLSLTDLDRMSNGANKAASRETFVLAELIKTEKAYVQDLRECIYTYMREMMTHEVEIPAGLINMEHVIFGNLLELYEFHHKIFLKELEKHESVPEDVGHCFVKWAEKFQLYVDYAKNSDKSTRLIVEHTVTYFNKIQQKHGLPFSLQSFLIKPIQRMTKYPLLIKNLLDCFEDEKGLLKEALEVTLGILKRANDAIHFSVLEGFDESGESQGELLRQEAFKMWDTKLPFCRGKNSQLFLLKNSLLVCKVVKDEKGMTKYIYKRKLNLADVKLTEHLKRDPGKFVLRVSRSLMSSKRIVLKASSVQTKLDWIEHIRKLNKEHTLHLTGTLKEPIGIPKAITAKLCKSQKSKSGILLSNSVASWFKKSKKKKKKWRLDQ